MITSGVIQGCSLSGSLFAIAMNPFFALAESYLKASVAGEIGGCADDVGVVVNDLRHLIAICAIFEDLEACSGLTLKPVK